MDRVFLSFTSMTMTEGAEYVLAHRPAVEASGAKLDMAVGGEAVLLRLTVPETMPDVHAEMMLPDFKWMAVEAQIVPVPESTVDLNEEEE